MRRILAIFACVAVAAAVLSGCGSSASSGGGSGGAVGTWTLDVGELVSAAVDQAKKSMPEEQKKMMTDDMLRSMTEKRFKDAKVEMTFAADHTCTMLAAGMPGTEKEESTGTWAQSGDTYTVTPKTKNGKPVEGEDAKAVTLTMRDGLLRMRPVPEAPEFTLRRK